STVSPPQTIIRLPVQTAVWPKRAVGAPVVDVGVQASAVHDTLSNERSVRAVSWPGSDESNARDNRATSVAREAFLDQVPVMAQRRVQFEQALRHLRSGRHAIQLTLEPLVGD